MRISIKVKFSIFLGVLLLLTVFIISLLVLQGIKQNQQTQLEQYFSQQSATANIYFIQTLMAESNKSPETFLAAKGREFAAQLELITGQTVVLYDQEGAVLNKGSTYAAPKGLQRALAYAQQNKDAYLTEKSSLYYMTPLRAGNDQVGVIQFHYSLSANQAFYDQIKQWFVYIGAGVFMLSFALAYVYFNSFALGIIRLNKTVDQIRQGDYKTTPLLRRDEIGELSAGIGAMSEQIMRTIRDKDEEREKLALAVQKLSLLDKQQKEFIGSVTHEFKTPLTSIQAYIDLLDMYPDDEKLLETSKRNIDSETKRLYEMVEKVLQLSALDKYDFEFVKERVDVPFLIRIVLNSLKGKIDKFGIELRTDLTEACVEADQDSMTLVLVNLLDNAIKYNRPRGHIQVSNRVQGGQVFIEIANTGIGIPEEVGHKIFDAFYTVDKNRARQNGGAGLGLSLAQKYAKVLGGSITLVSSDAEITLFRVSLPAYAPSANGQK
ncbi:sensor histidine kinase [Cohnella boryungensis]|uniref:histidine kinase n=1 Tax=Cohnella boryungensis TaxID=768479 RepID=A0ABV8SIU2_9BACL